MAKYNKKTVNDYILCNDMDEKYIEELEKDPKFMIEVIERTNDKEMLSFCNESLFTNLEFVEYIITKFKNDRDLIVKIADYFLNNIENYEDADIDKLEINILMKNIIGPVKDIELTKYRLGVLTEFININVIITNHLNSKENEFIDSPMHFRSIREIFLDRKIITDEFAKMIIDNIFLENKDMSLEKLIHKYTNDKKDLEKENINRFLLNIIKNKDSDLFYYVVCNIELLEDLKHELKYIYNRFDYYVKENNYQKILLFEKKLSEYYEENYLLTPNYGWITMEQFIIKKLHLEDIYLSDEDFQKIIDSDYYPQDEWKLVFETLKDKSDLISYKFYKFALDIAIRIFQIEDYQEEDTYLNDTVASTLNTSTRKLIPFKKK